MKPAIGDVSIVNLDVKVLFEWSDNIVTDQDEDGNPLETISGYVMKVLPDQGFIYSGQEFVHLYQVYKE
jgi:hypothetical protein